MCTLLASISNKEIAKDGRESKDVVTGCVVALAFGSRPLATFTAS